MKKYYYDPSKYPTYLDQLGIKYPTLRTVAGDPAADSSRPGRRGVDAAPDPDRSRGVRPSASIERRAADAC